MTHPTFTDRFTGKTYHYVANVDRTTVQPWGLIPFNLKDSKGREIGMGRSVRFEKRTLSAERPPFGGPLWPVGAPLELYVGVAHQHRNGRLFGGSSIEVQAATEAECAAKLDAAIDRAFKAAQRKHAR